jgi:hypothetical protein
MADLLVETAPEGGYPPAAGGVLSLETAWGVVLRSARGMSESRPDVSSLLRWTMRRENLERHAAAPAELRAALPEWLAESAGPAGVAILAAVESGRGADAVPTGLVCGIVHGAAAAGDLALKLAAVRLESHAGKGHEASVLRRWGEAAEAIVLAELETRGPESVRPWLRRAQEILADVEAAAFAWQSRVLPAGLEQRLARYAEALSAAIGAPTAATLAAMEQAADVVGAHALAPPQGDRADRLEMSRRLCRWLATPAGPPGSFDEAAAAYVRDGAFVDWARGRLRGGDPHEGFSAACERLLQTALARREEENAAFARLLQGWLELGGGGDRLLPIEDVLGRVVAPIAALAPVLLLVLDGMSQAVFGELIEDLVRRGRVLLRPAGAETAAPSSPPVIAALPSVTDVSRASLLSGALRQGSQPVERQGFAEHSGLASASRAGRPPLLLHKASLSEASATDLAGEVREALTSAEQRVIGLVLNAVDDYLLKSDQVRPAWRADYITFLDPILEAAESAGRVVVLTSDHGHVLELHTEYRTGGDGDRWRLTDGPPEEGEVILSGRRVLSAGPRLTALWSERARFGPKKNGYHGGASPQEVVVPLAVLAAPTASLEGWEEAALRYPDWWQGAPEAAARPAAAPARPRPRPAPARQQGTLFDDTAMPSMIPAPVWIDALLASEVYLAQKAASGRVAPADERIRALLEALDDRGGKLTQPALAQRLGLSPVRIRGTVAAVRRLLNVDGYDVLTLDEESDTVVLNLELLRVQFEIG